MKITIEHDSDDPGWLTLREDVELLLPFSGMTRIQAPYRWNGNSTPPTPLMRWVMPKWFYLIASLFHDYLCEQAGKDKLARERADKDYKWILKRLYKQKATSALGYVGVRIGAFFGVGK